MNNIKETLKQLIKVKQVYETPDGSKFDSELAAIAHIKRQLQQTPPIDHIVSSRFIA